MNEEGRVDISDDAPASPSLEDEVEDVTLLWPKITKVHVEIRDDLGVLEGLGFAIDRVGQDQPEGEDVLPHPPISEDNDVLPLYDVEPDIVITKVISLSEDSPKKEEDKPMMPKKNVCWNCEGDHMLTNCPKPKNGFKIGANRKRFLAAGRSGFDGGRGNKRYHEEDGPSGQCKPGYLSADLRTIMGLQPYQLPVHIYKMRVYGYPPGWLEHAMQESKSGLRLYGKDTVSMDTSPRKESDIKSESIILYPGYNAPPPLGTKDEHRDLYCPSFSDADSVESMIKKLLEKSGSSTSSSQPLLSRQKEGKWDFSSLNGLDERSSNSSGQYGLGRGRYIPSSRETETTPGVRSDNNVAEKPPRIANRPIYQDDKTDERYLSKQGMKSRRTQKRGRACSPSLLGPLKLDKGIEIGNPNSPVIIDLHPGKEVICFDSDEGTGSSGDIPNSHFHEPKRPRIAVESDDDDVMVIPNDGETSDKTDDSIRVIHVSKETKGGSDNPPPIIDLDSPGNGSSDWEETPHDSGNLGKDGGNSSGSTTDDERVPKISQPTDFQGLIHSQKVQKVALKEPVRPCLKEFIPASPLLQKIKGVLQANDDGTKRNYFHALPPFEKFAAGMPEMVLEEQPAQATRRLDRVLQTLKARRNDLT